MDHRRACVWRTALLVACMATSGCGGGGSSSSHGYLQTNLTSNVQGTTPNFDPNLVNPWAIAFNGHGPFWISDNGTGLATLYDTQGTVLSLQVMIPPAGGAAGPGPVSGQIYNATTDFIEP